MIDSASAIIVGAAAWAAVCKTQLAMLPADVELAIKEL